MFDWFFDGDVRLKDFSFHNSVFWYYVYYTLRDSFIFNSCSITDLDEVNFNYLDQNDFDYLILSYGLRGYERMIYKMFSIYDSKINSYSKPMLFKTTGEAERGLINLLQQGDSLYSSNPEDFTLFELGSFDDEKCEFSILNTPHSIGLLMNYVRDKKQSEEKART